jgi:hypothetical protein
MIFLSCRRNLKNLITTRSLYSQVGPQNLQLGPQTRILITTRSLSAMVGDGGQNPASSSSGWTGKVVGVMRGSPVFRFGAWMGKERGWWAPATVQGRHTHRGSNVDGVATQ